MATAMLATNLAEVPLVSAQRALDPDMSTLTLGIMARAPVAGHCKTRLARNLGKGRAAELYRAMFLDSVDALRSPTLRTTCGVGSARARRC